MKNTGSSRMRTASWNVFSNRVAAIAALAGAAACSNVATPAPIEGAPAPALVSPLQYLRQLSFDLRGRPPSSDEIEATKAAGAVSAQAVDSMLRADEFLNQVDEWHSAQLWPNISRYRPNAVSLFAAPLPHNDPAAPYNLGGYWGGGADISPDPALVNDKSLRDTHIVAIFSSAYRAAIRGTYYAYPNGVCDHRPEAEYPDPSVVGTAGNVYTVPAARSGTGVAYTANFYEE